MRRWPWHLGSALISFWSAADRDRILPKHILAMPHLGKHLDRIAAHHADRTLQAPARRRAGTGWWPSPRPGATAPVASPRAPRQHRLRPNGSISVLLSVSMVTAKRALGLGVFMGGSRSPHVVGQGAQAGERSPELLRLALEHLAAAQREQGYRHRTAPSARGKRRRYGRWCGPARRRPRPPLRRSDSGRRRRPRRRLPGMRARSTRGPTMVQIRWIS